ncbi:MAG: hypothetical protein ACJ75B_01750 [Flavisolibacter sp.]
MKLLLVHIISIYSVQMQAQKPSEFIDQEKKQITYREKQIAALKAYAQLARKGYDLAQKGLSTIYQIRNGDFELHQINFSLLGQVNPKIKKLSVCTDIATLAFAIVHNCKAAMSHFKKQQDLTSEELQYIVTVSSELIQGCMEELDHLTILTSDDTIALSDDARLKTIQSLREDMLDRFHFMKSFLADAVALSHHRELEHQSLTRIGKLYGLDH